MEIFMPTKIFSESNCVKNHGKELAELGSRALLVTGRHSSRVNGSLQDVMDILEGEKIPYTVFDEIEENPSIETVMKARTAGMEAKADFVIGIGGGSPMDAAKAIALMLANPEKDEQILYEKTELPYLPVAEVPTTAGTGSEITPYAILTIHEKRTKQSISHRIYPALALVDARYLKTAGRNSLVSTAVDTLAHLIESYLNTNANSLNETFSERGLRLWGELKDNLLADKLSEETYEDMMTACNLGGMAITHTGTSLPHGLSYPLTYELGMAHGKACGLFQAGYIRAFKDQERAKNVLEFLGFSNTEELEDYLRQLLGPVEIDAVLWEKDVDMILSNQAKLKNFPFPISKQELFAMLPEEYRKKA